MHAWHFAYRKVKMRECVRPDSGVNYDTHFLVRKKVWNKKTENSFNRNTVQKQNATNRRMSLPLEIRIEWLTET